MRTLEVVRSADYCDYIRPPIDRFGTLQFGAFDEIRDIGYYHGKTYFSGLQKAGLLRQMSVPIHDRTGGAPILDLTDDGEEDDDDLEDVGPGQLSLPSNFKFRRGRLRKRRKFSLPLDNFRDGSFSQDEI